MNEAPAEQPGLEIVAVNGVELAVWVWPGDGPPLLLAHATGFHGRSWDHIARRFAGRLRIAVDLRGHGRSTKLPPRYAWRDFGRDLAALAELWNLRGALGVGHSMGGHSTVCAAALRPETYSSLLLVDPTIFARDQYGTTPPDASFIRKRRNAWQSADEMFQRFRPREPFSRWTPEALRDYCEFAIVPRDGAFVLACPPEIEASIYFASKEPGSNVYCEIESIGHPVTVLRAGKTRSPGVFDLSASPTAPDLASHFKHGREELLADCSHYIPMEAPGRVAEEIRRLLGEFPKS